MANPSLRPLGRPKIEPINFDYAKRRILREYEVTTADPDDNVTAAAALIALDTADEQFTSARLVDQVLRQVGGKDYRLAREYCEIPGKFIEYRRVPYTYPAITAGVLSLAAVAITAVNLATKTVTAAGHGLSVNDHVVYRLNFYLVSGVGFFNYNGIARVTAVSGNDVTLSNLNAAPTSSATILGGSIFEAGVWRESQLTETVLARVTRDYYLPGVSSGITTIADIEAKTYERFRVYGPDGNIVNVVAATTSPTLTEYRTKIVDHEFIVAESYVERWKGNIHALVTVEVPVK